MPPPQPPASPRDSDPPPATPPLLTIAIPTFNRPADLALLLGSLAPQLAAHPEVELLVADNASTPATSELIRDLETRGLRLRYHRHPENIGSDANFVFCYEGARGHYFWLCGDDDIILPGALDLILPRLAPQDLDLVYVTSYGFREDHLRERVGDPLGRHAHTLTGARRVATVVNIMFTFISGIIANRTRLKAIPHEPPSAFIGTNLTQLSWTLPLLNRHRRSLVFWDRLVATRLGNSGGYSIGHVFGENLSAVTHRCLPGRPDLARIITNFAIRRWFPSALYEHRLSAHDGYGLTEANAVLKQTWGRNFRFWLFTWPVLHLPLPLARLWAKGGVVVSKAIYTLSVQGFWRKQS